MKTAFLNCSCLIRGFNTFLFLILTLRCFLAPLAAQTFSENIDLNDSTQVHVIETVRGDRFAGKIIEIEEPTVYFLLNNGSELTFDFQELVKVYVFGEVDIIVNSKNNRNDFFDNPDKYYPPENLIYSPTAFNYPKGTFAFRSIVGMYNTLDAAAEDNFMFGFGSFTPFFATLRLKGTFEIGKQARGGFGQRSFIALPSFNVSSFTHLYSVGTVGQKDLYMNFTIGYWFRWNKPNRLPLVGNLGGGFVASMGGGFKMGPNWRVMADVFYLPTRTDHLIIPGLLFNWHNAFTRIGFGFGSVPNTFAALIPILSYQRRF